MARATKALVEARTTEILRILLDGAETWDLCEYVRDKEQEEGSPWKLAEGETPLSYSQIRRYAVRAEKLIRDTSRTSHKRLLRKHQAQRRALYAKAVAQGDVRAAATILKDLAELQGLYPAKKSEVSGPGGGPIPAIVEMSNDERAAAITAIFASVGQGGDRPNRPAEGEPA